MSPARIAVLAAAFALLPGCSSLRIDVDVYKGPLVSPLYLQLEQVSVLAVGARPLLTQLRDDLKSAPTHSDDDARTHTVVNEVLSLYDDQLPAELGVWVERVVRSDARLQVAQHVLAPRPEEDQELWAYLEPRMSSSAPAELRAAYEALLNPSASGLTETSADAVNGAWRTSRYVLAWQLTEGNDSEATPVRVDGVPIVGSKDLVEELKNPDRPLQTFGANARFRALGDRDLVERHAELLFADTTPRARERFTNAVWDIAWAFHDSREALEEQFVASLGLLDEARAGCGDSAHCKNDELAKVAARIVASVVDEKTRRLAQPGSQLLGNPSERRALLGDEASTTQLRTIHEATKADRVNWPSVRTSGVWNTDAPNEILGKERRRYGIVRGPFKADSAKALDELHELVGTVRTIHSSLGGGRLAEGLETLVERSLTARQRVSELAAQRLSGTAYEEAVAQADADELVLLGALGRFSKKLWILSTFNKRDAESHASEAVTSTMDVLEAIATSITVQVGDILERRGRDEFLAAAATDILEAEARSAAAGDADVDYAGVQRVVDLAGGQRAFDLLIARLELERAGADAKDVASMDQRIATLRAFRDRSLFLRPPATYLTDGYPISALSHDPNMSWVNLLKRHRRLSWRGPSKDDLKQDESFAEIDGRYWQNVNRIRLNGAGNTNFAIAKDPTGNWYVKSYATDPEAIIGSMQGVAMAAIPELLDVGEVAKTARSLLPNGTPDDDEDPSPREDDPEDDPDDDSDGNTSVPGAERRPNRPNPRRGLLIDAAVERDTDALRVQLTDLSRSIATLADKLEDDWSGVEAAGTTEVAEGAEPRSADADLVASHEMLASVLADIEWPAVPVPDDVGADGDRALQEALSSLSSRGADLLAQLDATRLDTRTGKTLHAARLARDEADAALAAAKATADASVPPDPANPDDTVKPDDADKPDDAANPDDTVKPDDTVTPDGTGKPDDAAKPDDTAKPGDTAKPDDAVNPGDTAESDDVAKPDDTAKPSDAAASDDTEKPDDSAEPDAGTAPEQDAPDTPPADPKKGASADPGPSAEPGGQPQTTPPADATKPGADSSDPDLAALEAQLAKAESALERAQRHDALAWNADALEGLRAAVQTRINTLVSQHLARRLKESERLRDALELLGP